MAHAFTSIQTRGLRTFLARNAQEFRPHSFRITLAIIVMIGSVLLRLIEPWPMKVLFDHLLKRDRPTPFDGWFALTLSSSQLIIACAITTFAAIAIRAFAEYLGKWFLSIVSNRVINSIRVKLYQHLLQQPLSFFAGARGGDLVLRMLSDVTMLRDVSTNAIVPLLVSCLTLLGMWTVMFIIQWKLALLAFSILPLFWFVATLTNRKIRTAARKQRERESALASTVAESLSNIKLVQAMSLEQTFASTVSSQSGVSSDQEIRAGKLSAALERSVDLFYAAASGIVLFAGVRFVIANQMTPGELLVVLAYLKRSFSPISDFAKYTTRIAKASAAAERILSLQESPAANLDRPLARDAKRFSGRIDFDGVEFTYPDRTAVLNGVDLTIMPGEIVAVIGGSGAGKSTMTDLLLRFIEPTRGRILIDGNDIAGVTTSSVRAQIDVVLQETILFAGTIRDNITMGMRVSENALRHAVDLANAKEFVSSLPNGIDTTIGERGATLSHGQRQRISIARAALRQAPILILDEPTTGLDPVNRIAIGDAIVKLSQGRAVILITHDLELAERASRTLELKDGRLVEVSSRESESATITATEYTHAQRG